MTMGERIKEARLKKGYTQSELAELLGYKSRSSINKIEVEGRDIPRSSIVKFAQVLDVTPSYLMGWNDEEPTEKLKTTPYTPENMIPVPVIGKVAAVYTCLAEADIECYELVSPETINDGYEYVYLRVVGDSMEPLLLEGDMVLVRVQSTVDSGDYAVVIVDEEDGVVKRIKLEDKCITLISQNPYYPPREFEGKDMGRVRIFGKVVESKRKF